MTKSDSKNRMVWLFALFFGLQLCSGALFAQGSLPSGWSHSDIGSVGVSGSAGYASNVFTVQGSGSTLFGDTADAFHFAYVPLSGDGTITARIASANTYAQVGVMIRETLTATSNHMFMGVNYGTAYAAYRTGGGSSGYRSGDSVAVPCWVRVVRSGSTFAAYTSADGMNWTQVGVSQTISMAQNVYTGLVVAGDTSTAYTATFDNVSFGSTGAPAPAIAVVSATTGSVGSQVQLFGSGFGASQGSSVVLLHGTAATINSWSDTSLTITIPTGATSGDLVVSVAPSMDDSNPVYFTVTGNPLPAGWLDQDIGQVGVMGSAGYASNAFTVQGGGSTFLGDTADAFHFAYVPLSGDGAITARVTNTNSAAQVGVMIRETLTATSNHMLMGVNYGTAYEIYRTGGGSSGYRSGDSVAVPCWVRVVRSGSTFTAYTSADGVNWTQVGVSQTISMAQNVYMGLAVSGSTSTAYTATFDSVSFASTGSPAPAITAVSATTGSVGGQVEVSGSAFGTAQGSSVVLLNGTATTINSWSDTSITITIPSGATSGDLVVSVAPSMNDSNPVYFTVTGNPLPAGWLDQDIGQVGVLGSAGYASSVFTVQGGGSTFLSDTADAFHFAYVPLSGDGTITARVTNTNSAAQVGVMIRETLTATSNHMLIGLNYGTAYAMYRTGGGSSSYSGGESGSVPVWVRVARSGYTFTAYTSADGVSWTQVGVSQTISMAQNVYMGLAVSGSTSSAYAATFDNVSITSGGGGGGTLPIMSALSPTSGGFGSSVTISGSNFGSTQGTSTVKFNGTLASAITSWNASQIVASVPNGATTGPVSLTVNSVQSVCSANCQFTVINPVINSLSPPAAPVGGSVTVSGSGFGSSQGNSQVQFNGISANATSWSDTSITAVVPFTATTGPVKVLHSGVISNGAQFTLIEALSVTSASPLIGSVGSSVTITGAGFGSAQSSSTASFYGATAAVTSWSDTQIVATVPVGAGSGPVSVKVAGITAQGPSFTINATNQTTDSLGNTSSYTSEVAAGRWVFTDGQGSGCSSCTSRGVKHNTYDASGNTLTETDELGNTTTYTYDSNNNVASVSKQLNTSTMFTTSYTYNSFGEVLTATDPLGNVTTNSYDTHGNLLSVTSPQPNSNTTASTTQFAYDTKGGLTQITDPLGHITNLTYTSVGLIASIIDAQQHTTTYQYDARGNRTAVIDPINGTAHPTSFAYDVMNRLTGITYPDGSIVGFGYDYRGRRTTVTDQNNRTTTYAYDDADRLTSVTDPASHATTYTYDTENNLKSITDANGHATSFTYDAFGRVTQTAFPSSWSESYAYDAVGNLTSKTDRNGNTIQYVYDALYRLSQKNYPDSTNVEYVYDLVGKIKQVTDPTGTYGFSYDNMGRLIGTTTQYAFLPGVNSQNIYTYDAASNRTSLTAPDGSISTYGYDALNRLNGLANSWAGSFGFGYDALSRRTQLTRPNGITTNYSYDSLSHLLSVLHQAGANTLDGASYTYDPVGNRTSKGNYLNGVTSNFTYDPLYELTQVTQGSSTTESYSYDAVGNRLSSSGVPTYSYNSANELTSNSSGSYTYDANGNTLTDASGRSFTWDFENRLVQAVVPGTTTFKYDPFGRRIQKSGPLGTTNYLYDGDDLLEEVASGGSLLARYTNNRNTDQPLAELRSGATSYYLQDELGSVTSLTNPAGALPNTYTYDSYGKLTASTGTITNPFHYTARESDPETGLYYYRARYYDWSVGRFVSEDPLQFEASTNFYSYVENNPVNFIDPFGLQSGAPAPAPIKPPPQPTPSPEPGPGWGPLAFCVANPAICAALLYLGSPGLAGDPHEEEKCQLRKGKWHCTAKCYVLRNKGIDVVGVTYGEGWGSSQVEAASIALKNAANSTGPGFRTKHCHIVSCEQR